MASILNRRRSKKQKAVRAASKVGKKAVQAKLIVGTAKTAKKGAGTAAKGGLAVVALAKARKILFATGALAGAAVLAKKLRSGHTDDPADVGPPTPASGANASTPLGAT